MATRPKENSGSDELTNGMELVWADPRTLQPNPMNHRTHPRGQRLAMAESLDDLGWLSPLVMNRRTGRLLDGHMRRDEAIERNLESVPVIYLDLDEEREAAALAVIDRIVGLATLDPAKDNVLREALAARNNTVSQLLYEGRAAQENLVPGAEEPLPVDYRGVGLVPGEKHNYVMLLFRSEIDWLAAIEHFGLQPTQDPLVPSKYGIGRVVDGGKYLLRQSRLAQGRFDED